MKLVKKTIVLLLAGFISWQAEAQTLPLRGNESEQDTTTVCVPISLLRQANIKMLERDYYMELVSKKDTIIQLKDEQIITLNKEVLIKTKRANLLGITAVVSLMGLLITILIK